MGDIFEKFEGFKRIKNQGKLSINEIYEKIKNLSFSFGVPSLIELDGKTVIKFVEEIKKYDLLIEANENQIIIYREKDANFANITSGEKIEELFSDAKSTSEITINRAVEEVSNIVEMVLNGEEIENRDLKDAIKYVLKKEKAFTFKTWIKGTEYTVYNGNEKKYVISKSRRGNRIDIIQGFSRKTVFTARYDRNENIYKFKTYNTSFAIMKFAKNGGISTCEFEIGKNTSAYRVETLEIVPDNTKLHYTISTNNSIIACVDTIKFAVDSQYNIEIRDSIYENVVIGIAMVIENYIGKNDDLKGE